MIKIISPAKINLFLHIVDRYEDGFHELESIMMKIKLHDNIVISKNNLKEPRLMISGEYGYMLNENKYNNIILQVLKLFHDKYATPINFDIFLEKNIPIGAGMGGGSSNAGVLINFLINHYHIQLTPDLINDIQFLGSDIMFFVNDASISFISQRGQDIANMSLSYDIFDMPILIINPCVETSTGNIYKNFARQVDKSEFQSRLKNNIVRKKYDKSDIIRLLNDTRNDLTKIAIEAVFEIENILDFFNHQKELLNYKMSGSGSTCFAIFDNTRDLEKVYYKAKAKFPHFFIEKTNIFC